MGHVTYVFAQQQVSNWFVCCAAVSGEELGDENMFNIARWGS